jgi:hypothetical protein
LLNGYPPWAWWWFGRTDALPKTLAVVWILIGLIEIKMVAVNPMLFYIRRKFVPTV